MRFEILGFKARLPRCPSEKDSQNGGVGSRPVTSLVSMRAHSGESAGSSRTGLKIRCPQAALASERDSEFAGSTKRSRVESECGAVTLGQACVFPPLSFGGALVARP